MTQTYNPTWWERATNPDLITRGLNVGSGPPIPDPSLGGPAAPTPAALQPWLTQPAQRPYVFQRYLQFNVVATTPAVPIANFRLEVEAIIFNVYDTAANPVFWGSQNVTTTTGVQVLQGTAPMLTLDNNREQWELQRMLEYIAAMIAAATNSTTMPPYKAPRVVFDLSQIYLAAAAATSVVVVAFLPPELQ